MQIKDTQEKYGLVSRTLHWSMAAAIIWQMLSASAHFLADDTAIEQFFWPTHKPLGFLILVLAFIRLAWALTQVAHRPPQLTWASRLGHITLYALFIFVPAVGLLRQYGSGRAFEPLGIPLFAGFEGDKISWMVEPGNALHGLVGWVLLAAIIGHVFMVFWHRRAKARQDVLPRMLG